MANALSPVEYVDQALTIMCNDALCASNIDDWPQYRKMMLQRAVGVQTIKDTYPILRDALKDLKDTHGFFVTPNDYQQNYTTLEQPLPTGRMVGNIGYLNIPYYLDNQHVSYAQFADTTQTLIASFDLPDTKGWVIDLRNNGGGNMWPMIAGLGPLLDEGVLGSLQYVKGPTRGIQTWSYRDGAALWNDKDICAKGALTPYFVTNPELPIAILTSRTTGSSAEAVLISFIGQPNMRNFGSATAGLSTANSPFPLSDGSTLHLTTGVFADRNGKTYGQPIIPDEVIENPVVSSRKNRDDVLDRACIWVEQYRPTRPQLNNSAQSITATL